MTASNAAYYTFKRVFNDPSLIGRQADLSDRIAYYHLLNSYYENSTFDDLANWASYKSTNRLYRHVRNIYNPTRRLVDFYCEHVYRGRLSMNGQPFEDGTDLAIPFAEESDPKLLAAIGQLWQWTNWLDGKDQVVLLSAVTGECLIEVVDEVERGKVTFEIRWPGFVDTSFLDLDAAGNVLAYALEYGAVDEQGNNYTYRKEVTKEAFRYFKDEHPYDYGSGAVVENPYGFVPACWSRHQLMDTTHGAPAVQGSINKLDELNSLASLIHDHIAKTVAAPRVVSGTGTLMPLFGKAKAGATDELDVPEVDRESLNIFKGGPDTTIHRFELNLADAIPYMEKLLREIERDFPELTMYEKLADMAQVTGPAVSRLFSNVAAKLDSVAARHDQQSIKLFTMAVAIAGERIKRRDWRNLDRQQEKFRHFNLDSYRKGDLNLEIMARQLFKPTDREIADNRQVLIASAVALDGIVDDLEQLKVAGYEEDEALEIIERRKKEAELAVEDAQDAIASAEETEEEEVPV